MDKQETVEAILDTVEEYSVELPHEFGKILAGVSHVQARFGYFDGREVIDSVREFKVTLSRFKSTDPSGHYMLKIHIERPQEDGSHPTEQLEIPLVTEQSGELDEIYEAIANVQNVAVTTEL